MKQGVVVFLDILGFKGIWQRRNSDEILTLLNSVPDFVLKTYQHPPPEKNWPESSPPQVTILSDTIVITIHSESPHCLLIAANITNNIILEFFRHKILLRGAIGYGKYSQSGNSFIGPAIDDVANWHEKADLIGVICTPKTNYIIDLFTMPCFEYNHFNVNLFIKYDAPCKGNLVYKINCLNWPGFMQAAYKEMPSKNEKSSVRKALEGIFSEQDEFDSSVFVKYENTLAFIDKAVSYIEKHE